MFCFEFLQPAKEFVVVEVGDLWIVEYEVPVCVIPDLLTEFLDLSAHGSSFSQRFHDCPASHHLLTVVEHRCLPCCDTLLGINEIHGSRILVENGGERFSVRPDLNVCRSWGRRMARYPRRIGHPETAEEGSSAPADHHGRRGRTNLLYVSRLTESNAESFALTDRE